MSKKLDRETLAVHIIPQVRHALAYQRVIHTDGGLWAYSQLWSMSVSAKLTAEQFQRFMKTVREMGDRVERERECLVMCIDTSSS